MTETNKNLVRRYFAALDRFDLDEIKALMDPGLRFRCAGGTGTQDSVVFNSPAELLGDLRENVKVLYASDPGLQPEILNLMAEGERVAAEVRIRGKSIQTGEIYDNLYAFFFWIRGDRFVEIHEHLDTQYVAQKLLAPAGIASGAEMPWLGSKDQRTE